MSRSYAGAIAVLVLLTVLSTVGCGSHKIKVLDSTVTPTKLPADHAALRVRVLDAEGREVPMVRLSIRGECLQAPLEPYCPPLENERFIDPCPFESVKKFPAIPLCSGLVFWIEMQAAVSRPLRYERCRDRSYQVPLDLAPGQTTELTLRLPDFPCGFAFLPATESGSLTSDVESPIGPVPKTGKTR